MLTLAGGAARASTIVPPSPPAAGEAVAALADCHVAVAQPDRSATFSGEMSALAGTRRMAVRVDLFEHPAGAAGFRDVSGPGLGVWRRSAADVQLYRYVKQVVNLPAPAAFRAVIEFRWLDAHGRVIHQLRRHTASCEQPDERPLLRVGRVRVTDGPGSSGSGSPAQATYAITVRNDGRGPATSFGLVLSVNGAQQPAVTVLGVAPFSSLEVDTTAPRCTPGATITVSLDPQHHIYEAPGGGRTAAVQCQYATKTAATIGTS